VPGATVLASHDLPGSAVPSLHVFVPVQFDSPASVVAGTQYAIVAYTSGGSLYKWARGAGNSYADGVGFTTSSPPSGSAFWTSQPSDFTFKTYVVPPPSSTAPTGERVAALRKCKKKHSRKARRRCRRKAQLLPV
jgi:hypothetical protein